jgi:hypothetical protein
MRAPIDQLRSECPDALISIKNVSMAVAQQIGVPVENVV